MPVIKTEPLSSTLQVDEQFHRIYTNRYSLVATTDMGPYEIGENNQDLPGWNKHYRWGETYEDKWAFARNYTLESNFTKAKVKNQECYNWVVTVIFSTKFNGVPEEKRDKPLDYPPVVSGSFSNYQVQTERDRNGRPLINTAFDKLPGEPFTEAIDTLSLEFNTEDISLPLRAQMINRVNSVKTWGLEKRRIKLVSWAYKVGLAGDEEYINNRLDFHISYEQHPLSVFQGPNDDPKVGWYTTRPNAGFTELKPTTDGGTVADVAEDADEPATDAIQVPALDKLGILPTEPFWLNIKGQKTTKPTYLVFEVELEANFHLIKGFPKDLPGPFKLTTID